MKRCLFALVLALLLAATPGFGQESPRGIKVTSTLHDDGSRTDLQTDFDNLTAESKTYSANKKLMTRVAYTTDEKGQLLDGIIYNAKGEIAGRVSYSYDTMGRMTEQLDKSANGTVLRRLVYQFSPNGRVSGIIAYDGQGNVLKASGSSAPKKKPRSGKK